MKTRQIKCPQCGLLTFYSNENKSRPFCSDRCKLIDLGEWADEKFRVPTEEKTDFMHLDEIEKSEN
ncbi:MAG: DNA gyrase inhibitor YacG [Bdellovibrionales bacterium]